MNDSLNDMSSHRDSTSKSLGRHDITSSSNVSEANPVAVSKAGGQQQSQQQSQQQKDAVNITARARRRREEAVRRLVSDVQARPDRKLSTTVTADAGIGLRQGGGLVSGGIDHAITNDGSGTKESQDWIIASTVAMALERGLDRDLHNQLVAEAKENSGRIGQVCHDHSDVFLASVGKVVALGGPSGDLASKLQSAQEELEQKTAGPMRESAMLWEEATESHARSRALQIMVQECRKVSVYVEKARKQAALGRPRGALEAVDDARTVLTAPMSSLYSSGGAHMERAAKIVKDAAKKKALLESNHGNSSNNNNSINSNTDGSGRNGGGSGLNGTVGGGGGADASANGGSGGAAKGMITLEETPFGRKASLMLPKIENEVLMGARRGLNRWFLSLRSGGDGAKAGRAVLRRSAHSIAVGPGNLGLGGHMPPSYLWRAKVCDNLISRMNQNGRVVRSVRLGYWFERDAPRDAQKLETACSPGMERRAEAFATAFGWYRCWDESISLLVDPSDFATAPDDLGNGLSNSRHGGLGGSRHGGKGRSLGFRAKAKGGGDASGLTGAGAGVRQAVGDGKSKWATLLIPPILMNDIPTRKNDDATFLGLAESVHPVRRAEIAFKLLGKAEEFVQYYELNRFGDVQIGAGKDDKTGKGESRSSLSSLTGDDVGVGTNRIFFAKSLPHLCASVVGFSAVEAALELGHFVDEDDMLEKDKGADPSAVGLAAVATLFRESSEKYERSLVTELGNLLRTRAAGANLAELVRASCLMAAFRSALKIVHPSSTTRRFDKELLAMDVDILMTALKVAQDEQLKATTAIVQADRRQPVAAPYKQPTKQEGSIPLPEEIGLPFGLAELKQQLKTSDDIQFKSKVRGGENLLAEEYLTFSQSVPLVVRSIHARAIACASFALSQEELGQSFLQKKGSGSACYVLDCVEECVNVAAVGMKDGNNPNNEDIDNAVQVMANVYALQHSLPRLFGTLMRGMCHVGMIRSYQLAETFQYAEATLKGADKACDNQIGTLYTNVFECARRMIDKQLTISLGAKLNWVQKTVRDAPDPYCEELKGHLRKIFDSLGPMEDGSRAGIHFSCCGHLHERLLKFLVDPPPQEGTGSGDGSLVPISKIDAFGLKNLSTDVGVLIGFFTGTGVPGLAELFDELKWITDAMLDPELPALLRPENAEARKRKYSNLSLEKVGNVLEKYTSGGMNMNIMGGSRAPEGMLTLDKKEVVALLNIVRSQR